VDITRSFATRRAMRSTPSAPWSRSWPSAVASSAPAWVTGPSSPRPSKTASSPAADGQRLHQRYPGVRLAVIADRLPCGGVVIRAGEHRPQLGFQVPPGDLEQAAEG